MAVARVAHRDRVRVPPFGLSMSSRSGDCLRTGLVTSLATVRGLGSGRYPLRRRCEDRVSLQPLPGLVTRLVWVTRGRFAPRANRCNASGVPQSHGDYKGSSQRLEGIEGRVSSPGECDGSAAWGHAACKGSSQRPVARFQRELKAGCPHPANSMEAPHEGMRPAREVPRGQLPDARRN